MCILDWQSTVCYTIYFLSSCFLTCNTKILMKMNNLLIKKLIISSNEKCPEFVYTNPLLDKNVTKALSKSLVKILKISSLDSNINNSLRLTVLENIRKLCVNHPEDHLKIDDNVTELLITLYEKHIHTSTEGNTTDLVDRNIENWFITNYKELNLNSSSKPSNNPEVIQALLNLGNKKYLDILCKSITHWNFSDPKCFQLAKELWNNENYMDENLQNILCIKMKSEVEKILIEVSKYVLKNKETNIENVTTLYDNFNNIMNLCPKSCACFQMCCSIFNFIFILSKFDVFVQKLIQGFVNTVKSLCQDTTISLLYSVHLTHVVVLLDVEICSIPSPHKDSYVLNTIKYLKKVHKEETDLIMLLSHFPQWFDIYNCK